MTVLGLDASTGGIGAALVHGDSASPRAPSAVYRPGPARPAASLMDAVDALLARSQLGVRDLDGLAVAVGPGSYAGVRAAVATAKALAWAACLPLAAVGSLEAVAVAAGPATVAAALDARRSRVYGAVYRGGGPGRLPRVAVPPALWPRARWVEAVTEAARGDGRDGRPEAAAAGTPASGGAGPRPHAPRERFLLAGAGWLPQEIDLVQLRCDACVAGTPDAGDTPPPAGEPGRGPATWGARVAWAVAAAGLLRLARGERVAPLALVPAYVSEPDIGPAPDSARRAGAPVGGG